MDVGHVTDQSFTTILDKLQADRIASEEDAARHAAAINRFRALARPIVDDAVDTLIGDHNCSDEVARAQHAYKRVTAVEHNVAVHGSSSVCMTLADLGRELSASPDIEKLRRLRRRFALGCHPDRVTHADREQATTEMQMANDLIDQAILQCWQDETVPKTGW